LATSRREEDTRAWNLSFEGRLLGVSTWNGWDWRQEEMRSDLVLNGLWSLCAFQSLRATGSCLGWVGGDRRVGIAASYGSMARFMRFERIHHIGDTVIGVSGENV